jgi:hypothetical protein
MPQWVRGFVIPDVVAAQLAWADTLEAAEALVARARGGPIAAPARARLALLRRAYLDFNDGLRQAAERAALQATQDMRRRLKATTVRGDTGASPHLRDLIYAAPLSYGKAQTGWVGVGLVSELERATNRNSPGYGSYWRAQEYGTGGSDPAGSPITVPSQTGRIIFGYFAAAGGGDGTPPQAQYAGGGGPHPVFLTSRPAYRSSADAPSGPGATRSGPSGFGTINREIAPKRFIGIGANDAAASWRKQIATVQERTVARLDAL